MKYLVITFVLLFSKASYGFDYGAYEQTTFDDIYERSDVLVNEHREDIGISIPNPTVKAAFTGKISKMPYECSDEALKNFMKMVGFKTNQFPPINYCIELESISGRRATFHLQDSLVPYVFEEVDVGEFVYIWVIWAYTDGYKKKPYFLINAYEENGT